MGHGSGAKSTGQQGGCATPEAGCVTGAVATPPPPQLRAPSDSSGARGRQVDTQRGAHRQRADGGRNADGERTRCACPASRIAPSLETHLRASVHGAAARRSGSPARGTGRPGGAGQGAGAGPAADLLDQGRRRVDEGAFRTPPTLVGDRLAPTCGPCSPSPRALASAPNGGLDGLSSLEARSVQGLSRNKGTAFGAVTSHWEGAVATVRSPDPRIMIPPPWGLQGDVERLKADASQLQGCCMFKSGRLTHGPGPGPVVGALPWGADASTKPAQASRRSSSEWPCMGIVPTPGQA